MMQPPDNKRARMRLPSATLDALDNDLLIRCASYLDADGLAHLGRTSARFGIPQAGQQRSLVNDSAHQQFRQSATEEERSRLPKYEDESDIGLCRALELLRQPLRFDVLVGTGFGPHEHPASVTRTSHGDWSTAMSGHVMRGGRHFVEITIASGQQYVPAVHLGVMRPISLTKGIDLVADWEGTVYPMFSSSYYKPTVSLKLKSQRTARWGGGNVHCCSYNCSSGSRHWTNWDDEGSSSTWQGREGLGGSGGTIGLLLDLNEGTLSVFKNGRLLGVMKDGLSGEYCWIVTFESPCTISMSNGT